MLRKLLPTPHGGGPRDTIFISPHDYRMPLFPPGSIYQGPRNKRFMLYGNHKCGLSIRLFIQIFTSYLMYLQSFMKVRPTGEKVVYTLHDFEMFKIRQATVAWRGALSLDGLHSPPLASRESIITEVLPKIHLLYALELVSSCPAAWL